MVQLLLPKTNGIVIASSKAASQIAAPISAALHATATSLKLGCLEENNEHGPE